MPQRVGAHMGGLYLLSDDRQLLELVMTFGAARQFTRPWQHVGMTVPIPVADATRSGRIVWVGGAEEMARRYPRVAVAMPYAFCLAAVPLVLGSTTYGVLFLLWPAAHPGAAAPRTRGARRARPGPGRDPGGGGPGGSSDPARPGPRGGGEPVRRPLATMPARLPGASATSTWTAGSPRSPAPPRSCWASRWRSCSARARGRCCAGCATRCTSTTTGRR
ncbi:hypothetical protein ACFQ0M_40740 [Kitasatospora aburaviensis]